MIALDKFLLNSQKDPNENQNDKKVENLHKTGTLKRKYNEDYIEFGFIPSADDQNIPFCLICLKKLSNEAIAPSKLKRHLDTKHPALKDKPKSYFETLRSNVKQQSKKMKVFSSIPVKAQLASFKIAELFAKKKKPHSEAENVIMPALIIAVESMISHEAVEKI